MSTLFDTGVRPIIDQHLLEESQKLRNYGDYWSASSAGYCMRLVIMRRLGVPPVPEIAEDRARTQRVFSSGHIFHEWIQKLTKDAGISIAQEVELQDEDLMIRGHIDDLVLVETESTAITYKHTATDDKGMTLTHTPEKDFPLVERNLILYDYKTAHSASFSYAKDRPIGHYHKMQLGTYMYMLRNLAWAELERRKV